jgi:hypothetical protein
VLDFCTDWDPNYVFVLAGHRRFGGHVTGANSTLACAIFRRSSSRLCEAFRTNIYRGPRSCFFAWLEDDFVWPFGQSGAELFNLLLYSNNCKVWENPGSSWCRTLFYTVHCSLNRSPSKTHSELVKHEASKLFFSFSIFWTQLMGKGKGNTNLLS